MALYTLKTRDEALKPLTNYNGNSQFVRNQLASFGYGPSAEQTEVYDMIGRTSGANGANGSNDNFFVKRGKSIENALGTTGAAVASFVKDSAENAATDQLRRDAHNSMNDIAKKYGYNTWSDWQDAYYAAKDAGDTAKIAEMEPQLKEFQNQADINAGKATEKAEAYDDYRKNNYISKKINQDNTKFLGSAINTLSTAADLTGLTANPLANAVQGGIEGFADEMEQNGGNIDITRPFSQGVKITGGENFDWGRAGQNALIGATTGFVTGKVNQGISNALAKRAASKGLTNAAVSTGLDAVQNINKPGILKTVAMGAGRGAISGAVGGGTGAGLSSILNGAEFGQGVKNVLQGAVQGAKSGAVSGAAMAGANMAVSKIPGVNKFYGELQEAKKNWDESGDNFKERWANTTASGDSPVANRFLGGNQRNNVYAAALNELKSDAYTNEDLMALMQSVDSDEAKTLISKALEERGAPISEVTTTNEETPENTSITQIRDNGIDTNDINNEAKLDSLRRKYTGTTFNEEDLASTTPAQNAYENGRGSFSDALNEFIEQGGDIIRDQNGKLALAQPNNTQSRSMNQNEISRDLNGDGFMNRSNKSLNKIESYNEDNNSTSKKTNIYVDDTENSPATRIDVQNDQDIEVENPNTKVYNALTEEQNSPITTSKTSKEGKLRYAQGKELLAQYGAVDQPTARSARAVQSIQEIANAGFTKPEDVERMANVITGSNGEVSKLTKNMIKNASPVNTFAGEGDETISEYVENRVRLNSLSGTNKGKAVMETIKANLDSLPSRMPNSDVYEDNPEDVFKVIQNLEASAAELEGRGGNTYHRPTIENIHQADVLKDTANLLKNRLFDTVDVSEALTPEVAQNLKSYAPNNEKFAKWVDTEVMGAKNVQDLRRAQAPWVRMSKYIDNAYTQAATVGGRMASSVGDLSKVLTGKRNLISSVADTAWNSNTAHRARAAIYDKLADRAAAKEATQTNTPIQTEASAPNTTVTNTSENTTFNPATQVYNMLGRTQGEISGEQTREKLQDTSAGYVEPLDATSGYNTNTLESLANTGNTAIYNSLANTQGTTTPQFTSVEEERQVYFFPPTGDQWTDMLSRALRRAKNAEDYDAFGSLYEMYQDGIASAQKQATNNSEVKLTDKQRQANAAARALADFEQTESNFGYDVSDIPVVGALANIGGNDYQSKAEALALQIGYMLSGATVNKDEAQKIGMAYVPQPRDSEAIRKSKLAQLKGIISDYQQTYAE